MSSVRRGQVYLSTAEVAAEFRVTPRRIQQMAQAGLIPSVKSARFRRYLFLPAHLLEWLAGAELYVSFDDPAVARIVEPRVRTVKGWTAPAARTYSHPEVLQ